MKELIICELSRALKYINFNCDAICKFTFLTYIFINNISRLFLDWFLNKLLLRKLIKLQFKNRLLNMNLNIWQLICLIIFLGCSAVNTSKIDNSNKHSNVQFSRDISTYISILPEDYGFSSSEVYLKIYTSDKRVLFVGKLAKMKAFSLELPQVIDKVYFELFSENPAEKQFKGEIRL